MDMQSDIKREDEMEIKIKFVDFWPGFNENDNYFINILKNIFGKNSIVISSEPDFLFFSCFGYQFLKYDCVKIFFSGENIIPDFNLCDYAIGSNEIVFEDRYLRVPLYILYSDAYERAMKRNHFQDSYYLNRDFCGYVISNSLADPFREKIIDAFENYKRIDSGGKLRNNIGGPVDNKIEFISNYKFTLCLENSSACGYTTEKILEGFAGPCVPIYWGNPHIGNEFNPKAFINCHSFSNLDDLISYVKELDHDNDEYLKMIKEPIFVKESVGKREIIIESLVYFFQNIIKNGNKKRTNQIYVGARYEKRMRFFRYPFELYRFAERAYGFLENKRKDSGLKS